MKYRFFAILILVASCTTDKKIESLKKIKDNESLVEINIAGKSFYADNEVFKTKLSFDPNSVRLNLLSNKNGNIIISIDKQKWYTQKPYAFSKSNLYDFSNGLQLDFMIGKLKTNQSAEGYILSNGKLIFEKFTKDLVILSITGNLIKPADADIEQNFVPITGKVYLKKPKVQLDQMDENLLWN